MRFFNGRLTIYLDSWCPLCIKCGQWIQSLDWMNLIEIKSIRINAIVSPINQKKALYAVASVNSKSRVFYGFDSIYEMAKRLPLFWIFLPLFILLKWRKSGQIVYKKLAIKRKIIPIHCDKTCLVVDIRR